MYVYILRCSDGSYYTGVTNDLEERFEQHSQGIHPDSYTFSRRPLELVFYEMFNSPLAAIAFEKKLKKWSRKKKEALIQARFDLLPEMARKKFTKREVE